MAKDIINRRICGAEGGARLVVGGNGERLLNWSTRLSIFCRFALGQSFQESTTGGNANWPLVIKRFNMRQKYSKWRRGGRALARSKGRQLRRLFACLNCLKCQFNCA